jgi:hypothetical protein
MTEPPRGKASVVPYRAEGIREQFALSAGTALQRLREICHLSLHEVEDAAARIAERHGLEEFELPRNRLHEIEKGKAHPTMYRLYSLSVIYRRSFRELAGFYGLHFDEFPKDMLLFQPEQTHLMRGLESAGAAFMPTLIDPGFDLSKTADLGTLIAEWGTVPLHFLEQFHSANYLYGWVGTKDLTLSPLIPPGSLLQIDCSLNRVVTGEWKSELDRPIYFVEMREGYICCWCELRESSLILHSHPLSGVATRVVRYPNEADVLGQVIGAAMRFRRLPTAASAAKPEDTRIATGNGDERRT